MIEEILEFLKATIENKKWEPKYFVSKGNDNGFEKLVESLIVKVSKKFPDITEFKLISGHHFPDMILKIKDEKYGIELKSTQKYQWYVNGNSIFESISENDYKEIYILFGSKKAPGYYEVRYKKYWQATSDIKVTHSPRFMINMETQCQVFENEAEYKGFRDMDEEQKALFVQKHLREQSSGVKWYLPSEPTSINVSNFSFLTDARKNELIAEMFILFPMDLLTKKNDYSRCIEYLINTHYIYSRSLRDVFTAGGKVYKNGIRIPQVLQRFVDNKKLILDTINSAGKEFQSLAYKNWKSQPQKDFLTDYKKLVNRIAFRNFGKELDELHLKSLFDLM